MIEFLLKFNYLIFCRKHYLIWRKRLKYFKFNHEYDYFKYMQWKNWLFLLPEKTKMYRWITWSLHTLLDEYSDILIIQRMWDRTPLIWKLHSKVKLTKRFVCHTTYCTFLTNVWAHHKGHASSWKYNKKGDCSKPYDMQEMNTVITRTRTDPISIKKDMKWKYITTMNRTVRFLMTNVPSNLRNRPWI